MTITLKKIKILNYWIDECLVPFEKFVERETNPLIIILTFHKSRLKKFKKGKFQNHSNNIYEWLKKDKYEWFETPMVYPSGKKTGIESTSCGFDPY